jgi:hypothetical protein
VEGGTQEIEEKIRGEEERVCDSICFARRETICLCYFFFFVFSLSVNEVSLF